MRPGAAALVAAAVAVGSCGAACSDNSARVRAEIDRRGAAWLEARACLLGAEPLAFAAEDAFVVRLIEHPEAASGIGTCLSPQLSRPHEVDPGSPRIHGAWLDFERALAQLVARGRRADPPRTVAALGELGHDIGRRIDRVDRARAALRERAGMVAVEPPAGPSMDPAAGFTVTDARGRAIAPREIHVHGATVTVVGDRAIAIVRGPTTVDVMARGEGVTPAIDDERWGVWIEPRAESSTGPNMVFAGPLDAAGEPGGSRAMVARGLRVRPLFAVGDGERRAVVLQIPAVWRDPELGEQLVETLAVAYSGDGGRSWTEALAAGDNGSAYPTVDRGAGRAVITWTDGGVTRAAIVERGALGPKIPVVEIPATEPQPAPCVTRHQVWWVSARALFVQDRATGRVSRVEGFTHDEPKVVCGDAGLLSAEHGLLACRADRCTAMGRAGPRRADPMLLGPVHGFGVLTEVLGYVIAATVRESPGVVLRVPAGGTLRGAVELDGTMYAVFQVGDHARLIPVRL